MTTATVTGDRPASLDARLERAGAISVARHGRPVPRHYGSVATEVAVCRKAVGLAIRSDLHTLMFGGREPWLENLLERTLGGRVPREGAAEWAAGACCARPDGRRALVVGPPAAVASWRRLAREAFVTGSPVTWADRSSAHLPVSLLGPRAPALLRLASMPPVEPGRVATCSFDEAETILVGAGDEHVLALVPRSRAGALQALFEAGRDVGLALVGTDAVAALTAASAQRA